MPDSPYCLLAKGKKDKAFKELTRLRRLGKNDEELEKEFLLIKVSL